MSAGCMLAEGTERERKWKQAAGQATRLSPWHVAGTLLQSQPRTPGQLPIVATRSRAPGARSGSGLHCRKRMKEQLGGNGTPHGIAGRLLQARTSLRPTCHGHTTGPGSGAWPPAMIQSETQGCDSGFLQDTVSKNMPFPCLCLPTTPFPVSFVICLWSAGLTSQLMQRLWEGQIGFPAFAKREDTAGRCWSRC